MALREVYVYMCASMERVREERGWRCEMRMRRKKVVRLIKHFSLSETSSKEEMGMMMHLSGSGVTSTEAGACVSEASVRREIRDWDCQ